MSLPKTITITVTKAGDGVYTKYNRHIAAYFMHGLSRPIYRERTKESPYTAHFLVVDQTMLVNLQAALSNPDETRFVVGQRGEGMTITYNGLTTWLSTEEAQKIADNLNRAIHQIKAKPWAVTKHEDPNIRFC